MKPEIETALDALKKLAAMTVVTDQWQKKSRDELIRVIAGSLIDSWMKTGDE